MAGKGGARSSAWKKGQAPVKRKGTKHKRTVLKETLGLTSWERFKSFMENEGVEKLMEHMVKLKPKEFVTAYSMLAEYVKPKLQRTTVAGDPESPMHISVLQNLTFEQLYELKYGKKSSE